MNIINIVVVATALAAPVHAFGSEKPLSPEIIIEPAEVGPGDIALITVKNAGCSADGAFGGKKIYFNQSKDSCKAAIGIDLSVEPGSHPVSITMNGSVYSRSINVIKKEFDIQRLTLPKDMVELTPENEARVEREARKLRAIWPVETARSWEGNFINPRPGEIESKFGLRRIINNIPKNPHSGIDVSAEEGDEVRAPNSGVVGLIDDQFYSGISVILDHGQGIYTMFFHLSKILVIPGQTVKKGDIIALVGSTGRSTGAHLHWGVRMRGARVDPVGLLELKLE